MWCASFLNTSFEEHPWKWGGLFLKSIFCLITVSPNVVSNSMGCSSLQVDKIKSLTAKLRAVRPLNFVKEDGWVLSNQWCNVRSTMGHICRVNPEIKTSDCWPLTPGFLHAASGLVRPPQTFLPVASFFENHSNLAIVIITWIFPHGEFDGNCLH